MSLTPFPLAGVSGLTGLGCDTTVADPPGELAVATHAGLVEDSI
jgi:hypothetical protein